MPSRKKAPTKRAANPAPFVRLHPKRGTFTQSEVIEILTDLGYEVRLTLGTLDVLCSTEEEEEDEDIEEEEDAEEDEGEEDEEGDEDEDEEDEEEA